MTKYTINKWGGLFMDSLNCFHHQILVINPIVANNLANKERISQGQHVLSINHLLKLYNPDIWLQTTSIRLLADLLLLSAFYYKIPSEFTIEQGFIALIGGWPSIVLIYDRNKKL